MVAATSRNYAKATIAFRVVRFIVAKIILKILFRIKIEGLENLPKEGGYILAGNHLSWIDPFLMLGYFPTEPRIYFIAAREEVYHPAWRRFFTERVGGVIPIERDKGGASRELLNLVKETLEGGGVLGMFPEGDVSGRETGKILPFKRGLGFFAAATGAPIVPVAFSGTKELWVRRPIRMIVGKPIPGRKGGKEVSATMTEETAAALLELLPPPMPTPPGRKFLYKFLTNLFTQEVKEHPTPE